MTGTIELSDQEFKITMINMIRALMDKQHARTDRECKLRDGNPKKKVRDAKYCNIIEECFHGLISRLYMAEDRISELDDISIENLKTETQRK